MDAAQTSRITRRGATITSGLVWTVALIGGLAVASVALRPGTLKAESGAASDHQAAEVPAHQATIDALERLVARSHAVLGIVPVGPTPFTEIVLWYDDADADDRVDADEILVLAHSARMRVISLYRYDSDGARHEPPATVAAGSASFCRDFRAHPDVEQWTFGDGPGARDISDLDVSLAGSLAEGGALVRITLTWTNDPVDGLDTATVVADVRLRTSDD